MRRSKVSRRRKAEGRKVFFFEKKKQKTFMSGESLGPAPVKRHKSFLVLFFKKEHSFFLKP
jgi:hypothetical protein